MKLSRKQEFLRVNTVCCFCGGDAAATTVDHVPSRACFPSKIGPEHFEFPACGPCQNRLRHEELFFAFFCRMSDRDNSNYDEETSQRLISGIVNNLPHLIPDVRLNAQEKRRGLRDLGLTKPTVVALKDIPMAGFPIEIDSVIRAVGVKIALALFYKHHRKPARSEFWVEAHWCQVADQATMASWKVFADELGQVVTGERTNVQLGNRFRYRWSRNAADEPEIFAAICQFGQGLALLLIVSEDVCWDEGEDALITNVKDWVNQNYPNGWA